MKGKGLLLCAVLRMSICVLAVAAFVILALGGEPVGRWIPTVILALLFMAMDVWQLREIRKEK